MEAGSYDESHPLPVVRLAGLPFSCTHDDIIHFFQGLRPLDIFLTSHHSRFFGNAFVLFQTPAQAALALQRNGHLMGFLRVGVASCERRHYYEAIAHGNRDPRPYTQILRMRGLPYEVRKVDIAGFFREFNVGADRIGIVRGPDGRAHTGEAFVEFGSEEEARRALMSKDRMMLGSRFVYLFPSTPDEAAALGI